MSIPFVKETKRKIAETKKEGNELYVLIEGFQARLVDETTAWIIRKLLDAKIKFDPKAKVFLPNQRERLAVPKSPHKHKDSQEHFGRITHRRLIKVTDTSFADLNKAGLAGAYPQISRGVQIRIKV
ncbi:30S ribosomal protein S10 [endosymbiont GvMRE of Glomus versiforme]|uniref:30S ribosomal protein S10 n=1 Tax=endosymbiont GvMRE of Glomus versiforme TaxID=2039283 RepID=UPI000ECB03B3|nr:30S ribosomal protein S10 [endosymbiont GvMRE of Glomus versiforme]RHZ37651.1 30S ribosomal protein S10 [endosymbiont GvMRE of Glomus versiforme]